MTFADDLKRFSAKASSNMDQVTRTVTMQVANALVSRSPVDTGRFRANWQFSENAPAQGETTRLDKDGSETVGALIAAIGKTGAGGVTYLTNNVPYAVPLEYGHSGQAPGGMVRVTAREFQQYVNKALGELK